jgi:glycosyltransferase involved in cell wall biosynthesis
MVERLGRARVDRFVNFTDTLYRNASSRSVISPAIADEMRRRTGIDCSNFFRCAVEPETIAQLRQPAPPPPEDVIRIGYAGTIIAEPTFALFVQALQSIRSRLKRRVEIHLYGSHSYRGRAWFDPDLIVEHGFISESELHRLYRAGTWGLAIMHLDESDPRYNHFSFPCKFTMSLAAGLPLICIGHPKTPLVELAKNYQVGLHLTDPATLAERLAVGLEDFSRFPGYRVEILRCAEIEFNAARNRETMHRILNAAQKKA